jgi:hypothetical protein
MRKSLTVAVLLFCVVLVFVFLTQMLWSSKKTRTSQKVAAPAVATRTETAREEPRDSSSPGPEKPYLISGQVIEEQTGAPVQNATVVISDSEGNKTPTTSDDDGRYEQTLPVSGAYSIRAAKDGYAMSGGSEGVRLDEAFSHEVVTIRMTHTGKALSTCASCGTCTDQKGTP